MKKNILLKNSFVKFYDYIDEGMFHFLSLNSYKGKDIRFDLSSINTNNYTLATDLMLWQLIPLKNVAYQSRIYFLLAYLI